MEKKGYRESYQRWLENVPEDKDALLAMPEDEIKDAFCRELSFGTGGLRGVMGAGCNRMNVYTVAKASQGLADYLHQHSPDNLRIAIAYDTRLHSEEFSRVSAEVFTANGLTVFCYAEPTPTPMLSFAVRYYECSAGIVITASHNPSKYNGYKVYGSDGCQITTETAAEILACIQKVDLFRDVRRDGNSASVQTIGEDCINAFHSELQFFRNPEKLPRDADIIYTPLNGTGRKPVLRALRESGFTHIQLVPEQSEPDGNFPTCPYPNPEIREALSLGLKLAEEKPADLLLATDPDADRVGTAVRDGNEMRLISGNEMGLLLLDYIAGQRIHRHTMPQKPVLVKSIVTTDLAERIATDYGIETRNVLTGFKFIGEQIGRLESAGEKERYLFGFEESYGYLAGPYVRDKDAVGTAVLICEMFAFYRQKGLSLADVLRKLYAKYGYCLNTLHSYAFEGADGFDKMEALMQKFRSGLSCLGGKKVLNCKDYSQGLDGLPCSNVLKYSLEGNISVIIRPSGTEPKLKLYICVTAKDEVSARKKEELLVKDFEKIIG